ncbi:CBM35 domain-containing protein [Actinocrispum sp. NPDC049592]|uniref:carbohydrate-binding protein n=1 Tax=Actinocrispum sp. NPDC049592 TaxID=3154835 RepID=UPI00343B282C
MKRKLRWSVFGAGSCAAVAVVVTLLLRPADQPVLAPISVPQAQDVEPETTTTTKPSMVSILLPSAPVEAPPSPPAPPPAPPEPRRPATTQQPAPPPVVSTDFQAENARIQYGQVDSNYPGFTGSGFVNYDNAVGGSVEWTVPASAAGSADVVFRFANGSGAARMLLISVNGVSVRHIAFPATNGWADWQTLTVHVDLVAGNNSIKAIATTRDGGPNVDKITLT